ncbi:FAD-dependent monooxygenase [Catenuloplanes atrovinosus]|uniref:2-polyprenyl-6-methoxyphenol hydroxylase-like FAD-dependent oxidoreductase n=1 Tax=Catenuloplanes atrovinosus TaxID=137266 RepID=A0AAE3YNE9_9ACTN|nr:FAD-dependent monooxygenase [Catenuloplanes atrovinosus]MDR7277028.1 2-polyprenyl-6-methoxyphenol hydroxylase-like FAD-dependent oxidoreductase [Catenuloplanes atrovinosus]
MRILICGAGMAGLATAIDLGATGHDVTLVERAGHLRVNGSPIDIRGDAIDVARRMGLLDRIRDRRVDMTERVHFVDADGTVLAELPGDEVSDTPDDIEIPREDLARVLYEALSPATTVAFGESIGELHDDGDGVDVTFVSGRRDRFDLVVGADGVHSLTRRLTFGPERDYLRHLGFYVALTELPAGAGAGRGNPILNWPGHLIGITRYRDTALGVLNFRSGWIDYDYHDLDAQRRIVLDAFAGHDEWRVPEILDAVRRDPELYFDSVSQIRLPSWHRGRVVLVGDAAHCASPMAGRGASLALTGAWLLAEALRAHPGDLGAAFHEYETRQRPYAERAQATAGPGGDLIVPATQEALDLRNARLAAAGR